MRATSAIDNSQDVIDSRDVIARIEYLESERQDLVDAEDTDEDSGLDEWDDGAEGQELKALKAFAAEGESLSDWTHGVSLIHEDYFETYAEELAEDIGAVQKDAAWPNSFIDWKAAAEALQQDYTSIDFDGTTYYGR